MLGDLEKRDAFLNENQDEILDGLYSAYDLDPGNKSNRFARLIVSLSFVVLIVASIILYDFIKAQGFSAITHFNSLISYIELEFESKDVSEVISIIHEDLNDEIQKKNNIGLASNLDLDVDLKDLKDEKEDEPFISKELKSNIQNNNHFLKLDNNLLLQKPIQSEVTVTETLNRIQESTIYSIVNLTPEILEVAEITPFKELHDRLILSTAKWLEIPIISSDKEFNEIEGTKSDMELVPNF